MTMTYEQALAFIHGAYGKGAKNGLKNMRTLLARLGNPHTAYPSVHIAGTNGKGSVCAFTQAALRLLGYRTALYTSPFLQRYNERMRIDGVPIADAELAKITSRVAVEVEALRAEGVKPTEFEIGTAIAFLFFAQARVDIAVVEVGLGGQLDPTNVITPAVTAIATIGLDHTRVLGDTLGAIARVKAGIAKPGIPMALSAQTPVAVHEAVRSQCQAVGAPLTIASPAYNTPLGLPGAHQAYNAGLSVEILRLLHAKGWRFDEQTVAEGLRRARWPGRLEWIDDAPEFLLDGAHNPQGAQSLVDYLRSLPPRRTVLLTGILQDKDWQGMARLFANCAEDAVTVAPDSKRALDAQTLAEILSLRGMRARAAKSLPEALSMARTMAGRQGRVVIAGSLYLVGGARSLVTSIENTLLAPQ